LGIEICNQGRDRKSKERLTAIDKLKSLLAKDALNPDSKYKPNLLNSQRFARLSAQARGAGAEGGKLGDASQRGLKQSEKKKKTKKRHRSKAPQASPKKGTKKELYHGTERQAGNYPALGTDSGKKSGEKFAQLFQEKKSWEVWLEKGRWDEPKNTATDTHLKEESGRDTRVEVNELNAEIGQEATNERLDEAGRTGMFKPTDTPNFTGKKPKYVKGVEQTGDDISQSKEDLNIDIAHAAKSWELWLDKNEKWDKEEKELDKKYKKQRKGKKGKKNISSKEEFMHQLIR